MKYLYFSESFRERFRLMYWSSVRSTSTMQGPSLRERHLDDVHGLAVGIAPPQQFVEAFVAAQVKDGTNALLGETVDEDHYTVAAPAEGSHTQRSASLLPAAPSSALKGFEFDLAAAST